MALKILRVIARLNVGGPARHVILLNHGLSARGHRPLLIYGSTSPGEGTLEHLAIDQKFPVFKIGSLSRRISPISDVRALLRLIALMFHEAPDIVHTHTAKAGALGRLAALAFNLTRPPSRRCLVVHTFHGNVLQGYFNPLMNVLIRLAERTLGRMTDRVVAISPRQQTELIEIFRVATKRKLATIPLGLDLDPLLQLRANASNYRTPLAIPPEAIVLGYVGRMVPVKDLPMLVRAFALALTSVPNLWLVMAGDGNQRFDLEKLAAEAAVANRIRWLGWIHDLPRLYATMDICALSSLNEGTPVAIIEAMAAAKAVVATAVGGVPDLVQDGVTGLLVQPRAAEAFASAIVRLARNTDERRQFGENARQYVAARHSRDRLVDDVERLYLSALAGKRHH